MNYNGNLDIDVIPKVQSVGNISTYSFGEVMHVCTKVINHTKPLFSTSQAHKIPPIASS